DRLTVARDLLTESGSIFVQIGDGNVHRVRAVMDEVFGEQNFVAEIVCLKTSGQAAKYLSGICDYVLMYGKDSSKTKYRNLYRAKTLGEEGTTQYVWERGDFFDDQRMSTDRPLVEHSRVFAADNLAGQGASRESQPFEYESLIYQPASSSHWKPNYPAGMERLAKAQRLKPIGKSLMYRRYLYDFNAMPITNIWSDVLATGLTEQKVYVVQTSQRIIERCILLSTDPGDLVLDPTCGSGTTAYVSEQWGRRWITLDTSRVALALARARIMGARYPYYLLADSPEGQHKEAEITRSVPKSTPTYGNISLGFVYERVPHITLKSIANNTEIDVIWEKFQQVLEPLREQLTTVLGDQWLVASRKGKHYTADVPDVIQEWEVPREPPKDWPPATRPLVTDFWRQRIARQNAIDASIAAKADFENLYDKPYEDKKKVRVAGPFTVESLSPHRVLGVDEHGDVIDGIKDSTGGDERDFARMILENLKTAGVQQAHKDGRIAFTSLVPWPGRLVCAEGRYLEGTKEKRAGIFIGPEFGTVSRPDLVEAAREAGDADFDVLIACAFGYDAHSAEFEKLGRIPVLKARMNADLHMADDLKNTGKGNLFVIFGEPDIAVTSGPWLVTSDGRRVANYEQIAELSGLGCLEAINRAGRNGLSGLGKLSTRGEVRADQPDSTGGSLDTGEHRGGRGAQRDGGVSAVSGGGERIAGGNGNFPDSVRTAGAVVARADRFDPRAGSVRWSDAQRAQTLAALEGLTDGDFPLALTTDHWTQVTVFGVDVFKPQTGEVVSDGPDGIACWFVDTDYNEESFFVRQAYFLGANDHYKSLKTTLKAEINADAWETLHSDTSRTFPKPATGRIAVKVINHLGDEVMKVFKV
ncbi:MAG: DNA methyltransferase, partial [Rhodanobacteraceae bacterium]